MTSLVVVNTSPARYRLYRIKWTPNGWEWISLP